jgi:hypothetical protein
MAGTVASPSGQGDGGPGGIIMNSALTENGDYRIEVSQHTMESNYASGTFILEVVITPASAQELAGAQFLSHSPASGDSHQGSIICEFEPETTGILV